MKKTIIMLVILFGAFSHADAAGLKANTLRVGSTGETVKVIQQKLLDLGYSTSKVDGKYGRKTAAAVAKFQAERSLKADGLAGEKTLALIMKTESIESGSSGSFIKTTTTLPGVPTVPIAEPGSEIAWRTLCRDGKSHIQVLSPNGGEIYQAGQEVVVRWKSCNLQGNIGEINLVPLDMRYGHGMTYDKQIPNTGSYTLTLPKTVDPYWSFGKNFKIELTAGPDGSITDASDNLFTINRSSVILTAASSNQSSTSAISVNIGETFTISGTPQGLQGMTYGSGPGQFTMSYNFVQTFSNDNNCGNNEATPAGPWIMTCRAQVAGSSTFYVAININGQEVYRSNVVTVTIKPSTSTDICPNISGIQTSIPVGMIKDSSGNCVAGGGNVPTTTCVQNGNGNVIISLKPYISSTVARGAKNVIFASLDIANTSQTDICYMNGIQLGASADINNALENIRVVDTSSNTQIGSAVSGLVDNGSYYYQWVPSVSVMLKKQSTKSINIIADIKNATTASSAQMGIYGINFDIGAYSSGLPIQGNLVTINSIMNPQTS